MHDEIVAGVSVGDQVYFGVYVNNKGMPQAVDVESDGGHAREVRVPTGEGLYNMILPQVSDALSAGLQGDVANSLLELAELLGVTEELFGQLSGYAAQVLKAAGPKKAPQSWQQSAPTPPRAIPMPPRAPVPIAANSGPQRRAAPPARSAPYQTQHAVPVATGTGASAEEVFHGVVKSITPQRGSKGGDMTFGFVSCEGTFQLFGRDVFMHNTQANDLQVGQPVSFQVALNQRGMPQAINLQASHH